MKSSIKDIPVFQWSEKDRKELYDTIVRNVTNKYKLAESEIHKVLATGTRSYDINSKVKVFTNESDLDVIVQVLPYVYKRLLREIDNDKFSYPVENPLVTPRLSFTWNDIYISCFILPTNYNHLKYFSIQTMAVDLLTNKIYGKFNLDLYEYLVNKNRLKPDRICHICGNYIEDDVYKIAYSYISSNSGSLYDGITILCRKCYSKLIDNKPLAQVLKRNKRKTKKE